MSLPHFRRARKPVASALGAAGIQRARYHGSRQHPPRRGRAGRDDPGCILRRVGRAGGRRAGARHAAPWPRSQTQGCRRLLGDVKTGPRQSSRGGTTGRFPLPCGNTGETEGAGRASCSRAQRLDEAGQRRLLLYSPAGLGWTPQPLLQEQGVGVLLRREMGTSGTEPTAAWASSWAPGACLGVC